MFYKGKISILTVSGGGHNGLASYLILHDYSWKLFLFFLHASPVVTDSTFFVIVARNDFFVNKNENLLDAKCH